MFLISLKLKNAALSSQTLGKPAEQTPLKQNLLS
jgi:hypothetical protein